eukprot:3387854-Rhodomonas_salina.2
MMEAEDRCQCVPRRGAPSLGYHATLATPSISGTGWVTVLPPQSVSHKLSLVPQALGHGPSAWHWSRSGCRRRVSGESSAAVASVPVPGTVSGLRQCRDSADGCSRVGARTYKHRKTTPKTMRHVGPIRPLADSPNISTPTTAESRIPPPRLIAVT